MTSYVPLSMTDLSIAAALVALNSAGSTVDPKTGELFGSRYGLADEFAGVKAPRAQELDARFLQLKTQAAEAVQLLPQAPDELAAPVPTTVPLAERMRPRTLDDVVDRRLVLGTLGPVSRESLAAVARVCGPLWGWDEARCDAEAASEHTRRTALINIWRG